MHLRKKVPIYLGLIAALILSFAAGQAKAQEPDPTKPAVTMAAAEPAMTAPAPVMATEPAMAPTAEPAKAEPAKSSGKQDTWWMVLLGGLASIFLIFLTALAKQTATPLAKLLAKKMKIADQEQIQLMAKSYESCILFGINFAEQQAKKLGNDPDSKAKRIQWAIEKSQEMIKDSGLPEKAAGWVEDQIEAKIGEQNKDKPKET